MTLHSFQEEEQDYYFYEKKKSGEHDDDNQHDDFVNRSITWLVMKRGEITGNSVQCRIEDGMNSLLLGYALHFWKLLK